MTTLDKLIALRHLCETAVVDAGAVIVEVVTRHDLGVTELTVRYGGQDFVVAFAARA